MKSLFALFALVLVGSAQAAVAPRYQDIKLPTQVMVERQYFQAPIAALATRIVTGAAGATSAAVATLTTFTAQPDVPRNLTVTPTGTTTDVESCIVTVTGTNYLDNSISEDFTFAADASTAQTGSKAFKSVTNVSWAASCESGGFAATWNIGVGEKIGLKRCMDTAGDWVSSQVSGVYETTRATIAADATHVESNTADFNGTMNGSAPFIGYFFQNFRCLN